MVMQHNTPQKEMFSFYEWCLLRPERGLQYQQVMFGQKQALMSHLFTATTNNALCMNPTIGKSAYLCTDLPVVAGENATRIAGESSFGTLERYVVPARRGFGSLLTSLPRTSHHSLQGSMYRAGRTCDLAS
jgi:hypothetical protein